VALYPHACDRFQGIERLRKEVRRVSAKRVIVREGDRLDQFYTLFDGWAFRFRLLHDGRRQILSFLLPGSAIGLPLHGSAAAGSSVQALTDMTLCVFDRAEFAAYFQSSATGLACLEAAYDRLGAAADDRLVDLGRRSALQRLARFIIEIRRLASRSGEAVADTMFFPLKRQHIADALGLTPVHVGRVLGQLLAEKIVRIHGSSMTIMDAAALAELST
jgi:CRP-like cAMP-binding protein